MKATNPFRPALRLFRSTGELFRSTGELFRPHGKRSRYDFLKQCAAWIFAPLLFLTSCNTTKYIPQGEYLLEQVAIQLDDAGIDKAALLPYIQQKPNASKLAPGIYNLVNNDSNFIKKFIRKMGERPALFNNHLVEISVNELSRQMHNMGYLQSDVWAGVDTTGKKAVVNYFIHSGEQYRIRNYAIDLPQLPDSAATDSLHRRDRRQLGEGAVFDLSLLSAERARVSSLLRNRGYYTFTEENLHFLVDTALNTNQVDVTLTLSDTTHAATAYTVRQVNVFSGYDPLLKEEYQITDSLDDNGLRIYYDRQRFLRAGVLRNRISVRPGQPYRERQGVRTYNQLQSLTAVGRIDLQYENDPADSTLLNCNIFLTPGNNHSLQTAFGGTNKAGDLGLALDVTYGNLNLFNGSETFNLHLRGAYEFVAQKGDDDALVHNYYELGISPSLTFPKLHFPWIDRYLSDRFRAKTEYSLGYNIQRRPEYIRNFFNFSWKFNWTSQQGRLAQSLSILDVNYVFIPWRSGKFINYLLNDVNELTRLSYNDIFTAGVNYNLIYTNAEVGRLRQNLYTLRFNVETSGNAMYALSRAAHAERGAGGAYMLFDNPYAQYVKGDIHLGETFRLTSNGSLAYRAGIGVAYPYLNSEILPFEKRYYGGGPNHVRGWSTRYLGPGSAPETGNPADHTGDINLILSAEYRYKLLPWFEPAFFADAGNIWTIKSSGPSSSSSSSPSSGLFRWNTFYREIALGAGLGLRFDFNFLVFRLDAGTQIYDPAEGRFILFRRHFLHHSALYLAIGYPF
jgi:hypothetical protein